MPPEGARGSGDEPAGRETGVIVVEPERMNLLGLMLSSLLDRRLLDARARRRAARLHGGVVVEASGMTVAISFGGDRIEIGRRAPERPRARIVGTLRALLDATLGRNRIRNFLGGRLRVRGNLLVLWRVLTLVRA